MNTYIEHHDITRDSLDGHDEIRVDLHALQLTVGQLLQKLAELGFFFGWKI